MKDRFFMFWNSGSRNDDKRMKAADTADDYLEYCGTVLESIPGYEKVVELVSLIKQRVRLRSNRVLRLFLPARNTERSLSGRSLSNFEKLMTRGCRQIRRTGFARASEDKYEGLPTSTFCLGSRVVVRRWRAGRRVT